jgi:hypothetical protein
MYPAGNLWVDLLAAIRWDIGFERSYQTTEMRLRCEVYVPGLGNRFVPTGEPTKEVAFILHNR